MLQMTNGRKNWQGQMVYHLFVHLPLPVLKQMTNIQKNIGWIKLHNKFLQWEWFQCSEMVHLFIHLLLSANYKETRWKGIIIKPGQTIIGRHKLSEELGISEQTIRTCLTRLKVTNEITIKPTNRYSIVSITNWDKYQGELTNGLTNYPPTTNQLLTTPKEVKNIIPPLLADIKIYCLRRNNNIDYERFFEFYSSKGWMIGKNKMKDWQAAVRTWELKNKNDVKENSKWSIPIIN